MSETTATEKPVVEQVLRLAEKEHRAIPVIEAELTEATHKFHELERHNRQYQERRSQAILRRERAELAWKTNPTTAGQPFDPAAMPHLDLTIPPADTTETRTFHRQHYRIAALRRELDEAKDALVGAV